MISPTKELIRLHAKQLRMPTFAQYEEGRMGEDESDRGLLWIPIQKEFLIFHNEVIGIASWMIWKNWMSNRFLIKQSIMRKPLG